MVELQRINNSLGKLEYHLATHECACVSVSGGSDSDIIVHIIATYFKHYLNKVHFAFSNTGIEYRATLKHLDDLEEKYNIKIERVRGMPIPVAVKKYGVPFISKRVSEYISRLQKHEFDWSNRDFDELYSEFTNCKVGLRWWCNNWGDGSRFNIDYNKGLKEYMAKNNPTSKISAECCHVSKKKPLYDYEKQIGADLVISGERRCEGGVRSTSHSNCFGKRDGMDLYMPLFFWNDDTKAWYEEREKIVHSDCYTVYGLKRTGCVGCPFALKRKEELEIMQKFEPKLYKMCMSVFGEAYRMTDEYNRSRGKLKDEPEQQSMFD